MLNWSESSLTREPDFNLLGGSMVGLLYSWRGKTLPLPTKSRPKLYWGKVNFMFRLNKQMQKSLDQGLHNVRIQRSVKVSMVKGGLWEVIFKEESPTMTEM